MNFKTITIFILGLLMQVNIFAQDFNLKNGDIIFQEACSNDVGNSIKEVTSSIDNYQFTHVGIVYIDSNDSIFVLEANHPKTTLTPINDFLYPKKSENCYPKSVVGRLNKEFQHLIEPALKEGMKLVGTEYDYGFVLGNDKYYCSELIYEIFKRANNGIDVFPLNIMTFKAEGSDETSEGWIEYFNNHRLSIPEGKLGINPGAMSRSNVLSIVHYFD